MKIVVLQGSIVLAVAVMMCCLTACGGQGKNTPVNDSTPTNDNTLSNDSTPETEAPADEPKESDEGTKVQESISAESAGEEGTSSAEAAGSKVLVAYFSATGTTRKLAEYAAEVMDADLYEIVPEEPYTDADLNWNDKNSRTTIEMNDESIKPAINGSVSDMAQYDIVFIGYPIWWGDAPHIMDTFMGSYDFSGKTIVPFCTSGSSGIGSSAKGLHEYTDDSVTWLDGARLKSSSSKEDMADWIEGLSLGIEVK